MRSAILSCTVLIVATIVVYWQVGKCDFINYDDNVYVFENSFVKSGLTSESIAWAFTSTYASNWHPITWLSHIVDVQLFGLDPRGHHLTNVIIHVATTLLLFLLLFRVTDVAWKSFSVAALFALHPLHVESVAWVAERKDVLSAFFWFLTLFLYIEWVKNKSRILYVIILITYTLGLMSKPMLVTLPVVMLLVDYWPLQRHIAHIENAKEKQAPGLLNWMVFSLREKIPFLLLSVVSSVTTIYAQNKGGALKTLDLFSLWQRMGNAVTSYCKYLFKTVWPTDLAIYYPFPKSIVIWQVVLSFIVLLLVTVMALNVRKRHPYFVVGWLWFLVTLIPVIGFVQVGDQAMADRYTYIPLTGVFIASVWGFPDLKNKKIFSLLVTVILVVLSSVTWHQTKYWRNSITLFQHSIEATSDNYIAHNNLGIAYAGKGMYEEAIDNYIKAIEIKPNYVDAHYNLGNALYKVKYYDAAIEQYVITIEMYPEHQKAHNNLGYIYAEMGVFDNAILEYNKAIELNPYYITAYVNLGEALMRTGKINEAEVVYRKILDINSNVNVANDRLNEIKQLKNDAN